ncbi:secretory lipase [Purpureocillium lavendulum]|uniref:Secretory lipase n=1 Tax=Purpureocillium lavendulum TaxID=1247861 RepID=A0AB34FQZ4_9HYPO|nr:secretory lipase [Purpureocillium lavendulum]
MVALVRAVVSLALLAVAGAAPAPLADRATPTPPSKDPFYAVPAGIDGVAPGTILQHRSPPNAIAAFGALRANLEASHQFLYRTTDNHGNATATVLTVLIPHNADKSKVLSYQVAEDAASVDCAPSYALQLESATGPLLGTLVTQAELLLMEAALEQGWVVIVPDFLGPQGAYLANALAGHAVLDGIRAALNSADVTGIKSPTIAMWGYSGGSVATNWAAELQPAYAPELKIAGAAVGGTVPNITNVTVIDKHLKPQYVEKFHKPLKQCLVADAAEFLFADVVGMFDDRSLVYTNPVAVRVLQENALGKATPKIPFFWYKSVLDEVSPIADTDALVSKYCAAGVSIEYVRDIASEHGSYAVIGAPKALSWLKDIMEGQAPRKGCSKKTKLSTLLDLATVEILPKFLIDALLDLLGKPVGPILFG